MPPQDIYTAQILPLLLYAKHFAPKIVKGEKVRVQNIIDRALMALRNALSKHPTRQPIPTPGAQPIQLAQRNAGK